VNVTDLGILATNFNKPGGWAKGDFNGDDQVNVSDLGVLATYFNFQAPIAPVTLPRRPATPSAKPVSTRGKLVKELEGTADAKRVPEAAKAPRPASRRLPTLRR